MSENAYKQAGVDVEAGYESVRLIKNDVKKTAIEGVIGGIGGFGGLFEVPKGFPHDTVVTIDISSTSHSHLRVPGLQIHFRSHLRCDPLH